MQHFLFHHSLLLGDLIYALPGIKHVCETHAGKPTPKGDIRSGKAIIYLELNRKWESGAYKVRRDGITLTEKDFEMVRPLLLRQSYIEDVRVWNGEDVHFNLDLVMTQDGLNLPYGCISRWWFYLAPEFACDLSQPWLAVDEKIRIGPRKMIVVSRSARSHNPNMTYKYLEKYKDRILFIGLEDEHKDFCSCFFEVPYYPVNSFLEMALVINSAKFFVGNQSFPYAIAEALKVPRILETWATLPHVIPTGPHAYDMYHPGALEVYTELLMNLPDKTDVIAYRPMEISKGYQNDPQSQTE